MTIAVKVWLAFAVVVVFQEMLYGAVVCRSQIRTVQLELHARSIAVGGRRAHRNRPETVAPLAGAVIDTVGGAVQQTVWPLLNDSARVTVCGLISQYSATTPMPGPDMFSVLRKRLTLRGFIVWDFAARQADFLRDMGEWMGGGRVKYREDVVEGLEKAPAAFLGLLQGKNFGKLLVKVACVCQ